MKKNRGPTGGQAGSPLTNFTTFNLKKKNPKLDGPEVEAEPRMMGYYEQYLFGSVFIFFRKGME